MKAAGYVRVSTSEQKNHGLSVDSQIQILTEYCKDHNYALTIYNDAGYSAHKKYTSRPALLRLMDDVRKDKIDIILFTKLDRWFRSVADYYQVQAALDEHKVPWKAVQEDYETVTSSGRFKVNIMLSVAQSESERTSERIKAIHEYRRSQGKYVGTAPTGYKVVNSHLIKDEEKQKGMEVLFQSLLDDGSMLAALRKAKEYGITSTPAHMWRTIKAGAFHGDAFGYKCEPYITEEQHRQILASIKTTPPKSNHTYLFSKLVKCGHCGATMRGNTISHNRKSGRVYTLSYRCPSYQNTAKEYHYCCVPEKWVEEYLIEHLDSLYKDFKINVQARKKQSGRDSQLKRKNTLSAKLERLKILFVDGDITKDEYTTKRNAIQAEIDSIIIEPTGEIFQLPEYWKDIYDRLTPENKQKFWYKIIDRIVVTRDTKHSPQVFFKVDF